MSPRIYFAFFFGVVFVLLFSIDIPVPSIVSQKDLKDITVIADTTLVQRFYGELKGFPHTYEIRATEPFVLSMQILLPDIDTTKNNVSGIIIKEQKRGQRVEEITRLPAKDSAWESSYDVYGGDSYRFGIPFERELGAGVYRIEMSTPDNLEKYVLMIGTEEDMKLSYFELLGRLMDVKEFFGKSKLRVIESPFVLVPLLGLGAFIAYEVRRRRTTSNHSEI